MSSDDDARETILTPASPPVLEGSLAPSPYNFLFTGEDNIRVTSHNSLTGCAIAIQGRMWSARDGIRPFGFVHVPNTDRTARTTIHPLGEGYLLNLSVFATSGAPQIGQTFVRVQVIRGLTGAVYVLGTLIQDYLTSQQDLAWPGSPIRRSTDVGGFPRVISGTQPAFGEEISETVPAGATWELTAVLVELTTDANAANRRVSITYTTDLGSDYVGITMGTTAQLASLSRRYYWFVGGEYRGEANNDGINAALPQGIVMPAGHTFETATVQLQPGDRFGNPLLHVIERLTAA